MYDLLEMCEGAVTLLLTPQEKKIRSARAPNSHTSTTYIVIINWIINGNKHYYKLN